MCLSELMDVCGFMLVRLEISAWHGFGVHEACILVAFVGCSLIEYALGCSTVQAHHTGY